MQDIVFLFMCFPPISGLSWFFGFLAIGDAREIFQYIFCITASMQGFLIFILMTARDKKVRDFWAMKLCGWKKKKEQTSTSGYKSGTQLILGIFSLNDYVKCISLNLKFVEKIDPKKVIKKCRLSSI